MNIETKQIIHFIKTLFIENKLLFPGWVLVVMSTGMLLMGIVIFISLISILYLKTDLLTALLIGFFATGILGMSIGSSLLAKVFKDK